MSTVGSAPEAGTAADERQARRAVTLFPLLILLAAVVGYFAAGPVSAGRPFINPLLALIMFGMGLTLTVPDFRRVASRPLPVALGVAAQYVVMPLAGWAVAHALSLSPELTVGVILVGCAPGGTASNVVSYLARADTALSVTMTSVSTILAPVLTPLLTLWLAGEALDVSAGAMGRTIAIIVLAPVLAGLLIRALAPRLVAAVLPALPWFSVAVICIVVAIVVSGSAETVISAGFVVLIAVILHNALGYGCGYALGRLTGQPERVARTMAIEVGMQNSGLAAALATQYVSPAAALPGAVFSLWHNLSGALLAAWFRHRDARFARSRSAAPASSEVAG